MSAAEYREWMAFYSLSPFGDEREDMRAARIAWSNLAPHSKSQIDENDFRLFPDEANDLPDDISEQEKAWMLKLNRSAD